MATPNKFATIEKVYARGGWHLETDDGCGVFTNACAIELHAEDPRWGHLRKKPGQTQYNGHAVDAVLYLHDEPGQSQAIDIVAAAGASNARPQWLPDVPRYSPSDWYAPVGSPPASHKTLLGASLFWLIAGHTKYQTQLAGNLGYIKNSLGADFVRAFVVLGKDFFSGVDPWADLATDWRASNFADILRGATLRAADDFGLKVAWTLVGGRAQVSDETSQMQLVDKVAGALREVTSRVLYVEVWNEYLVNNAVRHELRNMARRFRSHGLGVPIALSSPNSIMGGNAPQKEVWDEVTAMYGGDSGANLLTLHPTRPEPIWDAHSNYGPDAPSLRVVGEPRGPGASAGGDVSNPAILAGDYKHSITSGAMGYVYHTMPGVWGGHCNGFPNQNVWSNLNEVPNADAIAAALKQLRKTGSIPILPPGPGGPMHPYPDEHEWWTKYFLVEVRKRYEKAGKPLDDNYPVWGSRTAYDIAGGLTKEASADKHLKELESALGLI